MGIEDFTFLVIGFFGNHGLVTGSGGRRCSRGEVFLGVRVTGFCR